MNSNSAAYALARSGKGEGHLPALPPVRERGREAAGHCNATVRYLGAEDTSQGAPGGITMGAAPRVLGIYFESWRVCRS